MVAPPGPPQIRTCTSNASGSSRRGAVPHTIRGVRGDTPSRLDVLSVVPTPVHDAAPPSLPGVREGPFPRFNTIMGRCDSLPSISPRFVSSLGDTIGLSPVRPHQLGTRKLGISRELVSRGSCRQSQWRRQGLPSSRETRMIIRQCSSDPGVTRHANGSKCR